MINEFVPHEEALALREIGFNDPCIACFRGLDFEPTSQLYSEFKTDTNSEFSDDSYWVTSPLFQQAFRWFRNKHGLYSTIIYRVDVADNREYWDWLIKGQDVVYRHFLSYEEAELACLVRLIDVVKYKMEKPDKE